MATSLQQWINELDDKDPAITQALFVRDSIAGLIGYGLHFSEVHADIETGDTGIATVISTHRSKSVVLPVYKITRPDIGLTIILRNNYFDWKMSVISENPIEADFTELFYTEPPREPEYSGNCLSSVYFEGFPNNLIFGYYGPSDKKKWSASICNNNLLYTCIFLIMRSLHVLKPLTQYTREEHRKKLDEDRIKGQWRDGKRYCKLLKRHLNDDSIDVTFKHTVGKYTIDSLVVTVNKNVGMPNIPETFHRFPVELITKD